MALSVNDLVTAKNESDKTVDVVGVKFPPHSSKVMSFSWMMSHFGDPRSILDRYQVVKMENGQTTGVAPRQVEVQRVNRMWNIGQGQGMRAWGDIPRISFYTMEGERILTAFDDPSGKTSTEAFTSVGDSEAQQDKIRKLERQVAQLLELSGLDNDAIPEDDADIPVDDSEASTETTSPWHGSEPLPDDESAIQAFGP